MNRWVLAVVALCFSGATGFGADGPLGAFPPETIELPSAESAPLAPLTVRVYPVADLVVGPPRPVAQTTPSAIETSPQPLTTTAPEVATGPTDLDNLTELSGILQSTVAPESWEMAGGHGHVVVHRQTLSLIVRQSDSVQEQISALLHDLRRCQEAEVQVSVQLFEDQRTESEADGLLVQYDQPLTVEEVDQLRRELTANAEIIGTRRMWLQNGGAASFWGPFSCRAVVASDRRSVLLHWNTDASDPLYTAGHEQHRIPDGRAVLIPLGDHVAAPLFALVSVQIADPPEEEQLLPVPELEDKSPTPLTPPEQLADEDPFAQPVSFITVNDSTLVARVYPVADLLATQMEQADAQDVNCDFELERLAASIGRGIGQHHWASGATITPHAATLSLVVRQSRSEHLRLAEFLTQLRRANDGYTVATIRRVDPKVQVDALAGRVLSAEEVRESTGELGAGEPVARVTLNTGLSLRLNAFGLRLRAVPTLKQDAALLEVASGADGSRLAQTAIPIGSSLLVKSRSSTSPAPLLITIEQIGRREPDEEVRSLPADCSTTRTGDSDKLDVKSNGAIQQVGGTRLVSPQTQVEPPPAALLTTPRRLPSINSDSSQPLSLATPETTIRSWNDIIRDRQTRIPREHEAVHQLSLAFQRADGSNRDEPATETRSREEEERRLAELREQQEREAAARHERQAQAAREAEERRRQTRDQTRAMPEHHELAERDRHLAEATEHLLAAGFPELARAVQEHSRQHQLERLHHRLQEIEHQQHALGREADAIRRQVEVLQHSERR